MHVFYLHTIGQKIGQKYIINQGKFRHIILHVIFVPLIIKFFVRDPGLTFLVPGPVEIWPGSVTVF
jgi:hypothetical protein